MNREKLFRATIIGMLACLLTCWVQGLAQEKGAWRALSKTARSVTGDVAFSDIKVAINFSSFTIANIRNLTPAEIAAVFDTDAATGAVGTLYRVDIPGTKKFLHGNTLCGGEDTQWIATYVAGRTLQLAFFSGSSMPVFNPETISASTDLCGIYSYAR